MNAHRVKSGSNNFSPSWRLLAELIASVNRVFIELLDFCGEDFSFEEKHYDFIVLMCLQCRRVMVGR